MNSTNIQSEKIQSSGAILPVQQQYPIIVYVISPILITYFGIYVMLRNHYLFKPLVQRFLKKNHIKWFLLREIIIDLLSSLSVITFIMSSLILSSSDQAIRLFVHNDLYWCGLCISILIYRNIKQQQALQMKVVIKNSIMLNLVYVLIIYQYFSSYSMLMMGLLLMAIYLINMIFKLNEQKFVSFIENLFNTKPLEIINDNYQHINNMESPQYLAGNFPVSKQQLQGKMQQYQPKLKRLKLKTRIAVTRKLLMLSLAVRISQQKMINKMKKDVGAYYGGLNGTTNQKVKRLEFEVKQTLPEQFTKQQTGQSAEEQAPLAAIYQSDDQLQFLFTIFPIKLFQSSLIISVMFTLFLNLTFGFGLDYAMNITSTIKYGQYFNNLYALLILPVLPNVSKIEYYNSMSLSTLWKYFLVGLFATINVVMNGNGAIQISNVLHIQVLLVIILMIFVMGYFLSGSKNQYKLPMIFFILFCGNIGATYYGISHGN